MPNAGDVLPICFGLLFGYLGIAALGLFFIRIRQRDLAVLWFGLHSLLYGIRLLASASVLPLITNSSPESWVYLRAEITYVIPLFPLLFLRETIPAWRRALTWLAWFQASFALCGLVTDFLRKQPESLHLANNVIILAYAASSLIAILRIRQSTASTLTLRVAIVSLNATVILTNLAGLGMYRQEVDPEPFGFLVSMGAFARLAAIQMFERKERLAGIDRDMDVARRIQSFLLPRSLPNTPQLQMAARYLPVAAVAGDLYDVLVVNPEKVGILIADVSGHGIPAALIASMVKMAAQTQLPHADDPGLVLAGMNDALRGNMKGQFVTAAYVFLDLEQRSMRYASAGHPPVLLVHKDGTAMDTAAIKGLALGLRANSSYSCGIDPIVEGDRLLLYTDGLLEATNPATEQFGEERLRESFHRSAGVNAEEGCAAILAGVQAWSQYGPGKPQEDDLTLLVVDIR